MNLAPKDWALFAFISLFALAYPAGVALYVRVKLYGWRCAIGRHQWKPLLRVNRVGHDVLMFRTGERKSFWFDECDPNGRICARCRMRNQ